MKNRQESLSAQRDNVLYKGTTLQLAEKRCLEVCRGFIPGIKAAESMRPLGPEVCFPPISPISRPFSAASSVGPTEAIETMGL
jgi:hypothetical protein